jgi:hypothetical protein
MAREAKLLGFVLLLIAVFFTAHLTGSHLGPVTTGHAQVSGPGMSDMNMGQGAGQTPAAARPRSTGQ